MFISVLLAGLSAVAPVAVPDTRFGVIATTQGRLADNAPTFIQRYDQLRLSYGGPIGIRLFSSGKMPQPGDGSLAGNLLTWAADKHPEELITVSHKTRDDAGLKTFLAWVHEHRLRASIIFFHEVQDNWGKGHDPRAEPGAYRATYRAYRAIIDASPAQGQVTLEKNMMWFWQRYQVPKGLGADWHEFVEPHDPADILSWDTYVFPGVPTSLGQYTEPEELFRYARDAWNEYHLPWGIGEIGSRVQNGTPGAEKDWDHSGAAFASWVARVTEAARHPAGTLPPARFVKWWGGANAGNVDESLEQVPAAVASYRQIFRTSVRVDVTARHH